MSELWTQLQPRLEVFARPFPTDAIELAHAHREDVAPHLVAAIEAIADDPDIACKSSYMLHLFAMHLLACWRDARAYRALARWGHLPQFLLDDMLGDVLHESYGRCLASLCDGDLAPIKAVVEDQGASDWARGAALNALSVRVYEGDLARDALIDYLQRLGVVESSRARLRGLSDEMDMLDLIVAEACDLGATEMLPTIREWFADGLLDETFADRPWVEKNIALPFDTQRAKTQDRHNSYVNDVAAEMRWFASYREDSADTEDDEDDLPWIGEQPYVRPDPKVGRNDPCPCGSGKKFKKCCGA